MALAAAVPGGGLLLASPVQAALRLFQLLPSAAFWQAAGNSSLRIFGGFLLSCALAALLAALAAGRPWLRDLLAPPVAAVKAGDIPESRHRSYVRLYEQARAIPDWERKET